MRSLAEVIAELRTALEQQDCSEVHAILEDVFPGMLERHYIKAIVELGTSAGKKGSFDKAVEYYRIAIDLQKQCFARAEMDARAAMHSLVTILESQEKHDEAKPYKDLLRL